MPSQSYVQVAPDGLGKKVANVAVTEPTAVDASGNAQADTTRYQQKVTVTGRRGDISDPNEAILAALARVDETLHLILAALS